MSTSKTFVLFVRNLSFLTVLLLVLTFSLHAMLDFSLPSNTVTIFGFFYFVVAGMHFGLLKANEKRAGQFVRFFMVATFAKLLIYITFLFLMVISNKDQSTAIIVLFFILYLIYTTFEITSFLGQLTNPKSNPD